MAKGAKGLDLSEAIIIMDYIAIKNTSYIREASPGLPYRDAGIIQDKGPPC